MTRDRLVLAVDEAELDVDTSTAVIDDLCARIDQAQQFHVAIDISHVRFMDSTAISGFVRMQNLIDAHDGSLELIRAQPKVRTLFRVLGLNEFVRLAPED